MENLKNQLQKFNLMGYSDTNAKYIDNKKGGKIIILTDGLWKYEDEFYGGEPYCGNETMWFKGKNVFRCVYWGKVAQGINFSDIYAFLREALKKGPNKNCVHRGPKKYINGNLTYTNECKGTINEFVQKEKIFVNEKQVYMAHFIGGLINIRS